MRTYRLHFALTLMFVFSTSLTAQIQFTSSDAQGIFATGKYWLRRSLDSANTTMDMKLPTIGFAQAWTLPSVVYTDSSRQDNMNPSSTPYGSSFPSSTHSHRERSLLAGRTNIFYNYSRITVDSLTDVGEVDSSLTVQIRQRKELFGLFPFSVGQIVSAQRDSQNLGGNSWQIQTRNASFDAYGSITSSAGTFQTVRRKETSIQQNYISGSLATTDTSVQFLWLTKDNYFFEVKTKYAYLTTGSVSITRVQFNRVVTLTGVENSVSSLPDRFQLQQNYPNPFNPSTSIYFSISKTAHVSLKVFNLLGQEVAALVDDMKAPGSYKVTFDARSLTTGIYFYKLTANNFAETRKMVLLK